MNETENSAPDNNSKDEKEKKNRFTELGTAFLCLGMAILLFTAPWYFAPRELVGDFAGPILSTLSYIAAAVFLVFVMSFAAAAFKNHPELRQILPGAGESEDGWQGVFGAATFAAIASSIHFIFITTLGAEGLISVPPRIAVYFFFLMALVMAGQALDGFVVRPLMARLSNGGTAPDPLARRVRKIGTAIAVAITLLAAAAQIFDVFFKD
jgi:hypothetical protein